MTKKSPPRHFCHGGPGAGQRPCRLHQDTRMLYFYELMAHDQQGFDAFFAKKPEFSACTPRGSPSYR